MRTTASGRLLTRNYRPTSKDNFWDILKLFSAEIVGAVVGASLGLLVNILLIIGVLWRRRSVGHCNGNYTFLNMIVTFRWFLMHWLVIHLLALVILFITSILVFVVQVSLWKLIGIIPVVVAIFTIYCWAKVTLVISTATGMAWLTYSPSISPIVIRLGSP